MSKTSDIDLLLIGKTGNGKSALGNAILRSKCFKATSTLGSVTDEIAHGYTEFNGKTIKVVDGPGIGDTRLDQDVIKKISEDVQEAIKVSRQGYHAILIVINFSCRFTVHDQVTIQVIRHLFGKDFLQRYCILVFTFGDMFESQNAGKTIDQWCREQDGEFKNVFDECQHRVVLFDNATKNKKKQEAQIDKLLEVVKNLPNEGHRYTDKNFELARAARESVFVESKEPVIRKDQEKQKIQDKSHAREKKNEKERKETGTGLGSEHQVINEEQLRSKADTDKAAAERRGQVEEKETKAGLSNTTQQKKDRTDSTKESEEGRMNVEQELHKVRLQLEEEQASRAEREKEILEMLRQDREMSQNEIDKLKKELKRIKEFSTCVLL